MEIEYYIIKNMIKKFCLLVLISLFWFNGLNAAEKISVNKLLADGFKIEKDETKIADGNVFKIYTLKKKNTFFLCIVEIDSMGISRTECEKP